MPPPSHVPAPRNTIETYSARPEREPPKNENGEIYCQHPDCVDKKETFRRPCEYNKHMDKHERPYKCNEPTCEQNPGFTYSGGLLRHMREVHKKGVGPARRPLFCPHTNCIRSTGEGFTRRENLEEHLRRRHSFNGHYSPPPPDSKEGSADNEETRQAKRLKTGEATSPNGQFADALQPLRRESQYAEAMLPGSLDFPTNGMDSDLTLEDANRQLHLARVQIGNQQETIRQCQKRILELEYLVQHNRAPDRSLNTPVASMPAQLDFSVVQDPRLQNPTQSPTSMTKLNGSYPPIPQQHDPRGTPGAESIPQAQSQLGDKDTPASKDSSNEPSRRIEIAKDLLTERGAAPIASA